MLNFREWRRWVRSKPGIHRWFIYIVLFRPVIDSFYTMKSVSPFLSPLYIAAAFTAVLSFLAIISGPRRIGRNSVDRLFAVWAVVAIVNMFFLAFLAKEPLILIENIMRYMMPFYLYFFIRSFIRNRTDLIYLFQTFLYSEVFVGLVFLYELILGPIRVETSRGFDRYVGVWADNYNYSFFIVLVFFVFTYLYMTHVQFNHKRFWFWFVLAFEAVFLSRVVHIATWGIFAFLGIWFLFSASIIHRQTFMLLLVAGAIGYSYLGETIKQDYVNPLTQSELAALRGEKPIERLGHGRMSRWVVMVPIWLNHSFPAKILGMPVDMNSRYLYMITGNVHNDFLRIAFLYGIVGFFCFLAVLILVFRRGLQLPTSDRYIVVGSVVVLSMYAFSGNSLLYAQLQYVVYAVFAFALLPPHLRENLSAKEISNKTHAAGI